MRSILFSVVLLLHLAVTIDLNAQSWNFVKEKNGVKVYTRNAENSSFKCFKGETVFHSTMAQLSYYIGNVKNLGWWEKNVKELNVIQSEPGKHVIYYLVYHVPWPFNDRDLCVEVNIRYDTLKGEKTVYAKPLAGVVPERKGIVRIKNYWQKWTLQVMTNDQTVLGRLEGFVDPAGDIPSWLYNMVITETPLNVMGLVKSKVETPPSR
jgi:hypothetical protein